MRKCKEDEDEVNEIWTFIVFVWDQEINKMDSGDESKRKEEEGMMEKINMMEMIKRTRMKWTTLKHISSLSAIDEEVKLRLMKRNENRKRGMREKIITKLNMKRIRMRGRDLNLYLIVFVCDQEINEMGNDEENR